MKRKQFITFVLTALLSMVGARALAHDIEVKNADGVTIYYYYNLANNKTELSVSYRGRSYDDYAYEYSGNVVIPESVTYNGTTYPVTSIGDYAFSGCSGLTSITIPNSVTSIGNGAFDGCKGLTSVTIPNSVTKIGNRAFGGCKGLTSVTIPNSVTRIFEYAFSGCSGLTSVTIGNSVTSIDRSTFLGCSGLTSVTIGNSVTSIDPSAFSNCPNLQNATVSSSFEKLIADKRLPIFQGTKIKTVSVKYPNGTKKQSNAWYWFDDKTPTERAELARQEAEEAKRRAELARQEAEARKSIDPNSMSWPAPSYDSGWELIKEGYDNYRKWVKWGNTSLILIEYLKGYTEHWYTTPAGSYKNYQDAEAAAYFYRVHGLTRTRGKMR